MGYASHSSDLDELARVQAGRIARWQLLCLGLGQDQATRLPGRLGWFTDAKGVYRLPGAPEGEIPLMWVAVLASTSWAQRRSGGPEHLTWQAVHQLACGAAGFTGFSAAWLHGLTDNAPTRPQVLLPHARQCDRRAVQPIRTRLPIGDLESVRGVPVVGALRMLWDCGQLIARSGGTPAQMMRLISRADGRRLVRAEDLHLVAREPKAYGLAATVPPPFQIAAFSLARGHSHSATESTARRIVTDVAAELGLSVEQRPLAIPDEDSPVAEADIAIPLIWLDIEIDGPHHDEPDQQRHDRWRDDQVRTLGWTVRRYPATIVDEDPERFRRLVRADILQAAAAAGITLRSAA